MSVLVRRCESWRCHGSISLDPDPVFLEDL